MRPQVQIAPLSMTSYRRRKRRRGKTKQKGSNSSAHPRREQLMKSMATGQRARIGCDNPTHTRRIGSHVQGTWLVGAGKAGSPVLLVPDSDIGILVREDQLCVGQGVRVDILGADGPGRWDSRVTRIRSLAVPVVILRLSQREKEGEEGRRVRMEGRSAQRRGWT